MANVVLDYEPAEKHGQEHTDSWQNEVDGTIPQPPENASKPILNHGDECLEDDSGDADDGVVGKKRRKRTARTLGVGPQGRGRFNNAEPTIWNGEDLDIPTFLRRNISLDV